MDFKSQSCLRRSLEERFWEKVEIIPEHACWEWLGALNGHGYGQISIKRKPKKSHHVSWFLHTGHWPKKWILHHCDNRSCIRPEHLYEGTRRENIDDMINRKRHYRAVYNTEKTHCKRGHEFTEGNTRLYRNKRCCRACANARK